MSTPNPLLALRDLELTEKEKQYIWTNICIGQRKSLFLRRVFFASRITGYAAISSFGIFVFISSYLPQTNTVLPTEHGALLTLLNTEKNGLVEANTIGLLLNIEGIVHVIQNGLIVPKTDIKAGELVVLQAGAKLVIQVHTTTFAEITGPATFVLEYITETDQTVLNLLEGNLIEVKTKISPISAEKKLANNTTQQTQKTADTVIIKTKFVEVTPPSNQASAFVISQEGTEAKVMSTAGEILVKKLLDTTELVAENPEELLVGAGKVAHVDTAGIALYLPENDDQLVLLKTESKNLRILYENEQSVIVDTMTSLGTQDMTGESTEDEYIALLDAKTPEDTLVEVSDEVLTQLNKNDGNDKKVLDPELLQLLSSSLNKSFSAKNLAEMRKRKDENVNAYIIAYGNLMEQVNRAYTLLQADQPKTGTDSLDAGIQIAQHLLQLLETKYTTPPSLHDAIQSIIQGLNGLKTNTGEHPSAENQEQPKEIVPPKESE